MLRIGHLLNVDYEQRRRGLRKVSLRLIKSRSLHNCRELYRRKADP